MQNWRNDPDFPGGEQGPWIESQVDLWRRANGKGHGGDDGGDQTEAAKVGRIMLLAKANKLNEEVRKLRIENDRKEGKSVDRDEAIVEMSQIFARMRDRFLSLPEQLANEVPAEVKGEVIRQGRRHINALLEEMAGWAERDLFGDN